MNEKYSVYGLDLYIESNWNGRGRPPLRIDILHYGNVWSPEGLRRRFEDYYPPDDDYTFITKEMSESMMELTKLCREYRLLDGDIQWDVYATNKEYREYIDSRAHEWFDWLLQIDTYWVDFQATKEYETIRNKIFREIREYEDKREREIKIKKKRSDVGCVRYGGRDLPKKIEVKDDDLTI